MALQKIKFSNGKIREVQEHLAFDHALQKQQGFVPCDDKGVPLPDNTLNEKKSLTGTLVAQKPLVAALDAAEEKQILEAYTGGASFVEIAKQHGLHWKKVEAVVKTATSHTATT